MTKCHNPKLYFSDRTPGGGIWHTHTSQLEKSWSLQVILDTLELTGRIKKTPVVVGNCTGFAVNRVFFPYTMAAIILLDLGLNPYQAGPRCLPRRPPPAVHQSSGVFI